MTSKDDTPINHSIKNDSTLKQQTLATAYVSKSEEQLKKLDFEAALQSINNAIEIYQKTEDWVLLLEAYLMKITIFSEQEKFDPCLMIANEGLLLLEKHTSQSVNLKIDFYLRLANTYSVKTQYDKALLFYQSALELQKEHHLIQTSLYVTTLSGLGLVYVHLGKPKKQILDYLDKARKLAIKIAPSSLINIFNNIGLCYSTKGDYDKSTENLNLAIEKDIEINGRVTNCNLYTNIALNYSTKGAHGTAIQYAYKALEVVQNDRQETQHSGATVYSFLGREYIYQDNFEKGLEYCHKAAAIWIQTFGETHRAVGYTWDMIASAYFYQKKYNQALPYFKKSLKIYEEIFDDSHPHIGVFNRRVGLCLFNMGEIEKSYSYFQKALSILESQPYTFQNHLAPTYRYIANYHRKKKEYLTALQYYQKGVVSIIPSQANSDIYELSNSQDIPPNQELFRLINNKAATFYEKYLQENRNLKDLKAAYQHYQLSCKLINLLRKGYQTEKSHSLLHREATLIYEQSIAVCKTLHEEVEQRSYLSDAFFISEQEKVHLLRTSLTDIEAKAKANISPTLLQKEQELRRQITELKDVILQVEGQNTTTDNEQEVVTYKSRLLDLELQYQKLIREFEEKYPEYHQLKYSTYTATVADVQAHLLQKNTSTSKANALPQKTNHHLLISYFVGEKQIYIFALTATQYQIHEIAKPADFEQLIHDFNAAINTVEIEDFLETATKLYQLLIAPLQLQNLKNKNQSLTILRHDVLHYLSFDALFFPVKNKDSEPTALLDFHDLDYLVYHFDIAYHYSATLWLHSEKRQKETQKQAATFLGLAPVTFNGENENTELALESYRGKSKVLRGKPLDTEALENLPNTAIEVNEVYQLFHEQKLSAKAFLYGAASKQNLFEEAPKHKYVLIATHGFNYDESGNLSGIYLAKNTQSKVQEAQNSHKLKNPQNSQKTKRSHQETTRNKDKQRKTTLLTTSESYLLSLNADLVVLSSCSSGIGALQKGEGMMALHRGFLYAGASNIIFTQFDIPDEMSSLLVKKLFAYVLEGATYASALRKAKLYILQQEGVSPQDWAAFSLIGG